MVCDFQQADFTIKLTRRTLITKLFCEHGQERINTGLQFQAHTLNNVFGIISGVID